jgi:hypothetical protein
VAVAAMVDGDATVAGAVALVRRVARAQVWAEALMEAKRYQPGTKVPCPLSKAAR